MPYAWRVRQICIFLLIVAVTSPSAVSANTHVPAAPDTVVVPSGALKLRAVVWRPRGPGLHPAVLFTHGSGNATGFTASGLRDQRHPEILGPVFARHGYILLYLFRRGDGLSVGQGTACGDLMDRASATGGQEARNSIQLRLLETDEMSDAEAGLAFLRTLSGVDPGRLAVVGHSFGGSLAFLLAERDSTLRAAVVFSAAGYSWDRSPELRARLLAAADRMRVPVFFIHAANDFSVGSGKALGAEMARLGRPSRLKIYAPVGRTEEEGHNFIHLKVPVWEPDVFPFLDRYMSR